MKQKLLISIFLLAIAFIILSIIFIQNSGKRTIKNDEKNNISSKNINQVKEENMDTKQINSNFNFNTKVVFDRL